MRINAITHLVYMVFKIDKLLSFGHTVIYLLHVCSLYKIVIKIIIPFYVHHNGIFPIISYLISRVKSKI